MKVRLVCFSGVDRQVVPQAFAGVVNRLVDTGCYIPVNLPSILHTVWYFACVCVFVCLVICMHVPSLSVIFNFDMNQSSCKHSFSRSKNPMILFYSIFSSAIGYVYVECEMFEVERVRGQCLLSLSNGESPSIFFFFSRALSLSRVWHSIHFSMDLRKHVQLTSLYFVVVVPLARLLAQHTFFHSKFLIHYLTESRTPVSSQKYENTSTTEKHIHITHTYLQNQTTLRGWRKNKNPEYINISHHAVSV